MEKSAGRHYNYDSYHTQSQQHKNGKSSPAPKRRRDARCLCLSERGATLAQGFFSNVGICTLLLGYTLLGAFIFLAIEGGGVAGTTRPGGAERRLHNGSSWLQRAADESRARTVENIWEITVSLNILYRDNWTRLAAQEIARFQEQLVARMGEEATIRQQSGASPQHHRRPQYEWNFARAFLYSLTVLTTIGYGSIAPRTALGKALTMGYAVLGIPLMLVYLSSVGALLSRCVRGALARALCCCLCSNCGYCCYDESRMAEKERRMRKKRQQMELQMQQQQQQLQEPFYVRSSSSVTAFTTSASSTHNNLHSPARDGDLLKQPDYGALDTGLDNSSDQSRSGSNGTTNAHAHCGSILAPVALCLLLMVCYICGGAAVLNRLESWSFLDGSYFCFMSLSTIGFGDLLPGILPVGNNGTVWFCSVYILTGMALTAMCFNILHDEIVHRLRHHIGTLQSAAKDHKAEETAIGAANGAAPS